MRRNNTLYSFLTRLLLLSFLLVPALVARPKIDVLVMKNGDRITCEIKALEQGQLKIKTSYTVGTIPVDWAEVERIESKQYFRVEMKTGERHAGTIELVPGSDDKDEDFRIARTGSETEVYQRDVVFIDQFGRSKWANFDGTIDAGFGFTKNNSTTSLDVNGTLSYKTDKRSIHNKYGATIKKQANGADTNRHNFSSTLQNQLKGNNFVASFVDLLKSDEQNLDLRTTLGGGFGRHLFRSNRTSFFVLGGAVFTRESFTDSAEVGEARSNAEGLVGATFQLFRFDSTSISASTAIFPSFNVAGRVRVDNDVTFKIDLWGDLYWNFSFWQNYDSKPPLDTSQQDYGVSSTVGWSF